MMGNNSHGQLGIGEQCLEGFQNCASQSAPAPCLVDSLRDMKVSKVACGNDFTMALIEGKTPEELSMLYTWGNNEFGQLGLDIEQMYCHFPMRLTTFEDQGVNIINMSGGKDHALFLADSGQAFASGSNSQGQLALSQDNFNQYSKPQLIDSL